VDPRLSWDYDESLKRARRIIKMYEAAGVSKEKVLIKVGLKRTWRLLSPLLLMHTRSYSATVEETESNKLVPALKGEPLARETASKSDVTILLAPYRYFSSLVLRHCRYSALLSLANSN